MNSKECRERLSFWACQDHSSEMASICFSCHLGGGSRTVAATASGSSSPFQGDCRRSVLHSRSSRVDFQAPWADSHSLGYHCHSCALAFSRLQANLETSWQGLGGSDHTSVVSQYRSPRRSKTPYEQDLLARMRRPFLDLFWCSCLFLDLDPDLRT